MPNELLLAPDQPNSASTTEAALRRQICEIGRAMWQRNMVAANDGNISALLPDGRVLCTPTGVSKAFLTEDSLPIVTLDGHVVQTGTDDLAPSSEIQMHLRAYQVSKAVGAVVHAHPPFSTTFAIKGEALTGTMMTENVVAMPEIPLAPYAMPSTDEVPDSIEPFITTHTGCLLEHHGALTWAGDLVTAYMAMERLEHTAQVTYLARQIDGERQITPERIDAMRVRFGMSV